jgi:Ca2+-transporting ATPase
MAIMGIAVFLLVWVFILENAPLTSLLKDSHSQCQFSEEIPVAFTTFMALGSWRLMKEGVIVKKIRTVESLGSATIICTDKTGTLTENKMSLNPYTLLAATNYTKRAMEYGRGKKSH